MCFPPSKSNKKNKTNTNILLLLAVCVCGVFFFSLSLGMSPSDTASLILQSTHIKHWTFASRDQLQSVLQQTNTAAHRFIVDNVLPTQSSADSASSSSSSGKKAKKSTLSGADLLCAEEELLVVKNNVQKMLIMCPQMHFSDAVESTAIQYFRRFFLHNSVMRYDITHIMSVTFIDTISLHTSCFTLHAHVSLTSIVYSHTHAYIYI